MSYRIHFAPSARGDLKRLYAFQLERDLALAERSLEAIFKGIALLRDFPFSCRKATDQNSFMRELLIPFGVAGYVVLFEIEDDNTVAVLAIRHQYEEDYH